MSDNQEKKQASSLAPIKEKDGETPIRANGKLLVIDGGFAKRLNFDGVRTVSFDYRPVAGSPKPGLLYLDFSVSINLAKTPYYYNQGNHYMNGTLEDGRWINITLVTDSASKTFDLYTDGYCIAENIPTRDGKAIGGEMQLRIYATRDTEIKFNDRVCQFRIIKHQPKINFISVESLEGEDRGGFGSTGAN